MVEEVLLTGSEGDGDEDEVRSEEGVMWDTYH